MLVGSSVPSAHPLDDARRLGCDVVQLHLSAPQQWRDPLPRADADELAAAGVVGAVHAPYLVNPASATERVRERSWHSLQVQLDAAATVGAAGLVVHAGQAGADGEVGEAIERWVAGVGVLRGDVPLLIENTATGNAAPGRHLDDWIALVAAVREVAQVTVGVCLDTCHAFAGDPAAAADPTGWVTAVREGLGGVDLLHVNDSKVAAGGGQDRHEALGDGEMGLDVLEAMVVAARAPAAVLETPGDDERRSADLSLLRGWATGTAAA